MGFEVRSVTFNQFGRGFPMGGMNQAGVVIDSCGSTRRVIQNGITVAAHRPRMDPVPARYRGIGRRRACQSRPGTHPGSDTTPLPGERPVGGRRRSSSWTGSWCRTRVRHCPIPRSPTAPIRARARLRRRGGANPLAARDRSNDFREPLSRSRALRRRFVRFIAAAGSGVWSPRRCRPAQTRWSIVYDQSAG